MQEGSVGLGQVQAGKEVADLGGRRLRRVGAVNAVALDVRGERFADGAGLRLRIGKTSYVSAIEPGIGCVRYGAFC